MNVQLAAINTKAIPSLNETICLYVLKPEMPLTVSMLLLHFIFISELFIIT